MAASPLRPLVQWMFVPHPSPMRAVAVVPHAAAHSKANGFILMWRGIEVCFELVLMSEFDFDAEACQHEEQAVEAAKVTRHTHECMCFVKIARRNIGFVSISVKIHFNVGSFEVHANVSG